MSKHTNGCAAVKGAKKNTNTAARKAAKKPAKRNAGSLPTWAEIERTDTDKAARIERWRGHAEKIMPTYRTTVLDAVANAAHLSPVEYVIAYLSEMRGLAGHHAEDDWMQKHNRVMDTVNETMHTRTRNHEERETVRAAVFRLSTIGPCIRDDDFTAQELQTLAVRFMRKGEWTLDAAIVRAAKAGLASGNA